MSFFDPSSNSIISKEFNITSANLDELEINRSSDGTKCYISEKGNKLNVYDRFILSDKLTIKTICEISFWTEIGNTKFIPRLTFKKIIKKTGEIKESKNDIIISFSSSEDGKNEFWKLISFLKSFKDFIDIGDFDNKFSVVDPEKVIITTKNKADVIKKIINEGYTEEFWEDLSESNPDLATKLSFARIHKTKKNIISKFEKRLSDGNYFETIGGDSWQTWIYNNNWLFGVNYDQPIEKTKINLTGVMPDFLFPTIDGFVDVLEIKLPKDEVIVEDSSHAGSWMFSKEANKAIGQVVNYLCEIDRQRYEIERLILQKYNRSISLLKPRAYILIGDSVHWHDLKKEGLRKLNHSLHGIEILTYYDLLERGKSFIKDI
jgi:hypothetical protein